MTQQEILEVIVKALDSKRAEDIQVLHVGELTILATISLSPMVPAPPTPRHWQTRWSTSSRNGVWNHAPGGRGNGSNWIVLDYADIIVHIFYKETRDFYQLERLWADGEPVDISAWTKAEQ